MKQDHVDLLADAAADAIPEPSLLEMAQRDAARLAEVEMLIEDYTKQIETLRAEREDLRAQRLPQLMTQADSPVVSVGNVIVRLKSIVQGNLPSVSKSRKMSDEQREENERKRAELMAAVVDLGHGGIIKRLLTVELPKGNEAIMHKAQDAMRALKLRSDVEEDIHWQTYQKFCRELCEDTSQLDKLPLDKLCIFIGLVAEVVK